MLNRSSTTSHIKLLHDRAAGINGKLVLASFDETRGNTIRHFNVGDVEGMTEAALALGVDRNVYAPVAVMRPDLPPGQKGTEHDVVAMLGLVADFDEGKGENYLERCPIKPNYVLETSKGNAQCFFIFDKPIIIGNEQDRNATKELAKRLMGGCAGVDKISVDLCHVWRISGLPNHPTKNKVLKGRDPVPHSITHIKAFDGETTTIGMIEALPQNSVAPSVSERVEIGLQYKQKIDLSDLANEPALIEVIQRGAPEGSRSEAVSGVVWKLLRLDYYSGDIADLIFEHPQGIGQRYKGSRNRIDTDVLRLQAKFGHTEAQEQPKSAFTFQNMDDLDESSIPVRQHVLENHLIKRVVTVLIAPPGVGKSTASFAWGLSVMTGRNLFDLNPVETGAVAFINNEDEADEMKRRIAALMKHHGITNDEIKGKLFFQSGQSQKFLIAKRDHTKSIKPHHLDDLIEFCKEKHIVALFIDPFLETYEGDENNNRDINEIASMYRRVAQEANCAVCIIHHTRKQQGTSSEGHAGNMDSGRGASSLIGAARIVVTLYEMSANDAKLYGVDEDERHLFIRMDDAKANLSLKTNSIRWYRRHSVHLRNGETVGILKIDYELNNALAIKKNTLNEILIAKINSHSAFLKLRDTGKMSREDFISAMAASGACLGKDSDVRSTLQERANRYLLGKTIQIATTTVTMKKSAERYFIYAVFARADLPPNAGISSA